MYNIPSLFLIDDNYLENHNVAWKLFSYLLLYYEFYWQILLKCWVVQVYYYYYQVHGESSIYKVRSKAVLYQWYYCYFFSFPILSLPILFHLWCMFYCIFPITNHMIFEKFFHTKTDYLREFSSGISGLYYQPCWKFIVWVFILWYFITTLGVVIDFLFSSQIPT